MKTPEFPGEDLIDSEMGDGFRLFYAQSNPHAWMVGPAVDVATVR